MSMWPMTLEDYVRAPWVPTFEQMDDGSWRATVPPVRDFEIFGTEDEVHAEWRAALASHIEAYLVVGKVLPFPFSVTVTSVEPRPAQIEKVVLQLVA